MFLREAASHVLSTTNFFRKHRILWVSWTGKGPLKMFEQLFKHLRIKMIARCATHDAPVTRKRRRTVVEHVVVQVGVVGFCMGGALSVASAVKIEELAACVCFYGVNTELADPTKITIPLQVGLTSCICSCRMAPSFRFFW